MFKFFLLSDQEWIAFGIILVICILISIFGLIVNKIDESKTKKILKEMDKYINEQHAFNAK